MNTSKILSQIEMYLDNGQNITTKWLSLTLGIDLESSRQLLSEYKTSHESAVTATYLISGMIQSKFCFLMISEADKVSSSLKFSWVSAIQLYSIQSESSDSIFDQVYAVEQDIAQVHASMGSNDVFLNNSFGGITFPGLRVNPCGERMISTTTKSSAIKESAEEHMARLFANKTVKPTSDTKSNRVANYFSTEIKESAKVAAKKPSLLSSSGTVHDLSSPVEEEIHTVKNTDYKRVPCKAMANGDDNDEADGEWDDGCVRSAAQEERARQMKNDATVAKITAALTTGSDDDGGEEEEEDVDVAGDNVVTKKRRKNKTHAVQHGAMDNYIDEMKDKEALEATATAGGGVKKRKRVLVQKMFEDAKGYLVTESVWEEVSEDECEVVTAQHAPASHSSSSARSATAATAANNNKKTAGTADSSSGGKPSKAAGEDKDKDKPAGKKAGAGGKKAAATATGGEQRSMMSFFGKKP